MRYVVNCLAVLLVAIFLASPIVHAAADLDYVSFLGYLDADRAWSTVSDLAGDRFEGRRAGTQGAELASEYIADYFNLIGLRPAGTDGTYRTKFTVPLWELVQMPSLSIVDSSKNTLQSFEYRKDFFVMTGSGSGDYSAEVVFAGYGITAPNIGYDDYSGISVRGKIVLAIIGTPPSSRFGQDYAYKKAENALKHGAVGLILADSPAEPTPHYVERSRCYQIGACWTIYDGLALLGGSVQMADTLLGDTGFTLDSLQQSIDQHLRPKSILLGTQLHVLVQATFAAHADAYNVLGFILGSDASSGKVVIIGAHYDHWGKDVNGAIFRGADDNASGVAVMMEIARVFSAGAKPKWSVLFAAWSGEEEGFYGAYAYVNHPHFALGETVAYLNLDMVGYGEPLLLESAETHAALRAVATESAKQLGVTLSVLGYEGGSDHAPFEENGVPNLMLIYWPYERYHTPSDTPDHVSRANLLDTARLTALIALKLSEATVSSVPSSTTTKTTVTTVTSSIHATSSVTGTVSATATLVTIEPFMIACALLVVVCATGVLYIKRRRE
jgi:hypothetical protein